MKEYRPIPEWDAYGISSCGEIIRLKPNQGSKVGKILKPQKHPNRLYLMVRLNCFGKQKTFDIHRLVAMTWIGKIPKNYQVCHINGNPLDNRVQNLRIDTKESNEADKLMHGKSNRGNNNGQSIYPEWMIKEIKKFLDRGTKPNELAKIYPMSATYIRNIKNGYKWKWLNYE